MKQVDNLLEDWYEWAIGQQSEVLTVLRIDQVDSIHYVLLHTFGREFFKPALASQAIHDINWIHSLLVQRNGVGTSLLLLDIVYLINYYHKIKHCLDIRLEKIMADNRMLRDFFFELFIFRQLNFKSIPHSLNPSVNRKVLEGFCLLGQTKVLFECKKVYYPKLVDLDVLIHSMMSLYEQCERFSHLKDSFLFAIRFKYPLKGNYKQAFNASLKDWSHCLDGVVSLPVEKEFSFGTITGTRYEEKQKEAYSKDPKVDLIFFSLPASQLDGKKKARILANFNVPQSSISDKIKKIVEKAICQHKNSYAGPKLIFIDSEFYSEFQMGVLPHSHDKLEHDLQSRISGMLKNEIVCIINRRLSHGNYELDTIVCSSQNLLEEAQVVRQLFEP